ncbi:unnamed protein product, partial [Brenthis ino]
MNIQRTPPKTSKTKSSLRQGQSLSESDISCTPVQKRTEEKLSSNVTLRGKRQRLEDSPNTETTEISRQLCDFKKEVMEMLTSWKNEQDLLFAGLVRDVGDLKTQCAQIQQSYSEIDQSLTFMNESYEEIKNKLTETEMRRKESEDRVAQLEMLIQDFQLQSRQATIELRNVPIKPKETTEDLFSTLSEVGNVINVEVQSKDVRDVYRLPGNSGIPRPIVAEFTSVKKKTEFLTNVRRFNKQLPLADKLNTKTIGMAGDKKPIYVDEHLLPSKKKLFFDARAFAKSNNFHCWSSNGRIFLRKDTKDPNDKPTQIKTDKCLLALVKKQ